MSNSVSRGPTAELPRALSLRDLVLFNLAAIVGIRRVATAGKAGSPAPRTWRSWPVSTIISHQRSRN
jgi:hypothetical protein